LTQVVEPNNAAAFYAYDVLGNLTCVAQDGGNGGSISNCASAPAGSRQRTFSYDSLSRLVSSSNPETGTIAYSYLNAGGGQCSGSPTLPCSKTDARGVQIAYSYDALNRLTGKSYSDGTSYSDYQYDWSLLGCGSTAPGAWTQCNTVGRLSYIDRGDGSTDAIYGYDAMGRVNMNTTCLFAQCPGYNSYDPRQFVYDLAGNITDIWYPRDDGTSQPHLQQQWDAAGHLIKVFTLDDGPEWDYFQSPTYYPSGQASSISYGNGVVENVGLNDRLQTTSITAANAFVSDTNPNAIGIPGFAFMSRSYSYNPSDGLAACTSAGNNGNIWRIADNLNPSNWGRQFGYDCLNRLTTAQIGSNTRNYAIDSFGNMSAMNGVSPLYTFDPATNRINNLPCASSLQPFDAAGNQLCDTDANGANGIYSIDAEERQTAITVQGSSTPYVTFTYSPEGDRIQKADADGSLTQYMYGNGQLLSEKDQSGNWTDYIYANGAKIAAHHSSDVALHLHGTATAAGGYGTYFINGPIGYTVKSGDKLVYRQYQTANTSAGLAEGWFYGLGGFDPEPSDYLSTLGTQDGCSYETVDLSPHAGGQFQSFRVIAFGSAPGDFDAWFADMAIVSGDGSVIPISTRGGSSSLTQYQVSNATNVSFAVDKATVPSSPTAETSTTYFFADNIGTTQFEVSSGGWPIYAGQFDAYGQELAQPIAPSQVGSYIGQPAPETFRFTGKERDAESGLDYFGARYLGSSMGRWTSPDPGWFLAVDLGNPQSWNQYAYVINNPLTYIDPNGLCYGEVKYSALPA
jgi:RHS repeat-associated protein